jgi:hypothetical protein
VQPVALVVVLKLNGMSCGVGANGCGTRTTIVREDCTSGQRGGKSIRDGEVPLAAEIQSAEVRLEAVMLQLNRQLAEIGCERDAQIAQTLSRRREELVRSPLMRVVRERRLQSVQPLIAAEALITDLSRIAIVGRSGCDAMIVGANS